MKIWIIWKTNVGKSTLFNRILWNYRVIVSQTPGTTKELIFESVSLDEDKNAVFFDSPWLLDFKEELVFIKSIINDSDILIFVVDGKTGVDSKDEEIKNLIIRAGKKDSTILVVNKLDKGLFTSEEVLISEYYEFGFNEIIWVAAQKWENVDILTQKLIDFANDKWIDFDFKDQKPHIPLAIIWRPNVW